MTHRLLVTWVPAVILLLLPLTSHAADVTPLVHSPTLAQALAAAEQPRGDVFLAVAAEKVTLPGDAEPPPPGLTVPQVADGYGRITRPFETVTAIAPPTMVVLNTDPGAPNPYQGMPPADALKLLLAGLSDAQWRALTGAAGLGVSDLASGKQTELFQALFPTGSLTIQSDAGGNPTTLTPDDLRGTRVRLSQRVQVMLPVAGQSHSFMGTGVSSDGAGPHYSAWDQPAQSRDTLYGVRLRDMEPNAPKDSDLDYDAASLKASVPLTGVKTVGDLVARIGAVANMELYADRRYEARTVTLLGPPSARAKDLLRALALSVTGTYRKIGPAYVLTDDRLGAGTRRMILARFAQDAAMARAGALADAGDQLISAHGGAGGLPPLEPGLGITDAQKALNKNNPGINFGQASVEVPFGQLTPQQQDLARRELQQFQKQRAGTIINGGAQQATLDGKILLQAHPALQILSPNVPGPVDFSIGDLFALFQLSAKRQQQLMEQQMEQSRRQEQKAPRPTAMPPLPTLASLLARVPRRAVLAGPRTANDVDALVAAMKTVGLNQLWLDVFSEGHSHLDRPASGGLDILAEALKQTRGTGILVVPTLDLLQWTTDAPEAARDLTILGETSAEAQAYQLRYQAAINQSLGPPPTVGSLPAPAVAVCSAAPPVLATLSALVKTLVTTPGVAALALRDTVTPGYDRDPEMDAPLNADELGYTVPLRLACLRQSHVDPLDLDVSWPIQVAADTTLPEFDAAPDTWPVMQRVNKQWNATRSAASRGLLARLLLSAQQSNGRRLPFLVKQRGPQWTNGWWGLWDDLRAPLPTLTQQAIQTFSPNNDFAAFAHAQCRMDVYALSSWAGSSPESLVSDLQQMKPGWDGFVLDLSGGAGGNPLAGLAQSLVQKAKAAASERGGIRTEDKGNGAHAPGVSL